MASPKHLISAPQPIKLRFNNQTKANPEAGSVNIIIHQTKDSIGTLSGACLNDGHGALVKHKLSAEKYEAYRAMKPSKVLDQHLLDNKAVVLKEMSSAAMAKAGHRMDTPIPSSFAFGPWRKGDRCDGFGCARLQYQYRLLVEGGIYRTSRFSWRLIPPK